MATIELGELAAAEPPVVAAEMSGATRRALLAAAVAVACVLGLAGSARAERGLGEPLWSGPVSLVGYGLGPRSVYLAEPNGRVVLARELTTGASRWRLDIDSLPQGTLYAGDGVAAVQTRIPAPADQGSTTVMLVREDTGQVLGRTAGSVLGPATEGHRLLLMDEGELRNDACPTYGEPCVDIVSVDTTTGAEVARLSLSGDDRYAVSFVDNRVDSFATYRRDGMLRVYDAATGDVVDTMPSPEDSIVTLTTDRVTATRRADDGIHVAAYRRAPLRPLWEATLPAPVDSNPDYPTWWVAGDCGPLVCVQTENRTTLLDGETGQPRFAYDGEIAGSIGGGVLAGTAPREPGPQRPQDIQLIDPATGAVVATVPDATGMAWQDSGGRAMLLQTGAARTAFVTVDRDGRTRVLGSVDGVGLNCQARADVLACASPSGLLRVWSLPIP